jgi:hypothetical protein
VSVVIQGSWFKSAKRPSPADLRSLSFGALRVAPWVVFGPITGIMSEAAIAAYRKGHRMRAGAYVALNIAILASMPLLTALIVSRA